MAQSTGTVSAAQQKAPCVGYLGTTASSRAKLNQDSLTNTSSTSSTSCQGEEEGNVSSDPQPPPLLLSSGPEPHQDQATRDSPSTQKSQDQGTESNLQVLTMPTDVTSEGGASRWSVSGIEQIKMNQSLSISPAPSITPMPTCDVITCPTPREQGSETRTQSDPASDPPSGADLPTSSSSPLAETPCLPQTGSGSDEEEVSLQQCQHIAIELRETARRAVRLYRQLGGAEQQLQMSSVLQEAFDVVSSELQAVLQGGDQRSHSAPSGVLESEGTMSLLEKYSELLLQMTQNKLNRV